MIKDAKLEAKNFSSYLISECSLQKRWLLKLCKNIVALGYNNSKLIITVNKLRNNDIDSQSEASFRVPGLCRLPHITDALQGS